MARARTLALCGLDRGEEAAVRGMFDDAVRQCGIPWALTDEASADALLIDVDSMYGQMSWLRAQGGSRPIIALTGGSRADADFLLPRPATVHSLGGVLSMLAERVSTLPDSKPAAPAMATPKPKPAAEPLPKAPSKPSEPTVELPRPPEPATPTPAAVEPPAAEPPAAPAAPRELKLVDFLRESLLSGIVSLRGAEPALAIDLLAATYVGGNSLKALLPLAGRVIDSADWLALDGAAYQRLASSAGGAQPLVRLTWIAGLGAGGGELLPSLAGANRFKLGKYPTTEREFPKHIRIATAMLKQLSTPDELASASGMPREEVIDFINACAALDLLETDQPTAPSDAGEPARGGLLGRLRGRK